MTPKKISAEHYTAGKFVMYKLATGVWKCGIAIDLEFSTTAIREGTDTYHKTFAECKERVTRAARIEKQINKAAFDEGWKNK